EESAVVQHEVALGRHPAIQRKLPHVRSRDQRTPTVFRTDRVQFSSVGVSFLAEPLPRIRPLAGRAAAFPLQRLWPEGLEVSLVEVAAPAGQLQSEVQELPPGWLQDPALILREGMSVAGIAQ